MVATLEFPRRPAATRALRLGLLHSAFLHLTLAVALFASLRLLAAGPHVVIPDSGPDWPAAENRIVVIDTAPEPGPAPAPVAPSDAFEVVPSDLELPPPVDEPAPGPRAPAPPDLPGGTVGGGGAVGTLAGSPNPGPAFPAPSEYVYHDTEPEAVLRFRPAYNDVARQLGLDGRVVVRLLVGVDGHVVRAEVERSDVPLLEPECLAAARRWVFRPATANDHPVAVWVRVPFDFRMN